jgi:hypothetical protein
MLDVFPFETKYCYAISFEQDECITFQPWVLKCRKDFFI